MLTRPYLHLFLNEISKYFTIVIYTTGAQEVKKLSSLACYITFVVQYAETVVKAVGISKYMKYLLHRSHCVELQNGVFVKDISFLDVPLDRILLIDVALH